MPDLTQITPNLYVGSNPTRAAALAIARMGITNVVDLRGETSANGAPEVAEPEIWAGTGVQYAYVPMRDNGTAIPAAKYAEAVDLITSAIRAGGKVLVHCSAGHYRSPSVAYAYLRKTGLSPSAAWDLVARRPGANRQYLTSAERYLNGIGISGGSLVTGPGGTAGTSPASKPPSDVTTPSPGKDTGTSAGVWLAVAAIAIGVVALAKSGPRHNPTDAWALSEAAERATRHAYRAGGDANHYDAYRAHELAAQAHERGEQARYHREWAQAHHEVRLANARGF